MNLLICDIDGCLARLTPEQEELVKKLKEKKIDGDIGWPHYYSYIPKQEKIFKFQKLLHLAKGGCCHIVFITSRSEMYREQTTTWLYENFNIHLSFWDRLFMRPSFDRRPSFKVKKDLYNSLFFSQEAGKKQLFGMYDIGGGWRVAIEDNIECQDMYKRAGVMMVLGPEQRQSVLDKVVEDLKAGSPEIEIESAPYVWSIEEGKWINGRTKKVDSVSLELERRGM